MTRAPFLYARASRIGTPTSLARCGVAPAYDDRRESRCVMHGRLAVDGEHAAGCVGETHGAVVGYRCDVLTRYRQHESAAPTLQFHPMMVPRVPGRSTRPVRADRSGRSTVAGLVRRLGCVGGPSVGGVRCGHGRVRGVGRRGRRGGGRWRCASVGRRVDHGPGRRGWGSRSWPS